MLEKVDLFAGATPEELAQIESYTSRRRYPRNTVIVAEGDTNQSLFVIVSGRVKVTLTGADGGEIILRFQGPGEYFGELALLDDAPRSASVIGIEPTELMVLPKAGFERCLVEHPTTAIATIRALTGRVRTLTEEVRALALLDVYGRLSRVLTQLAEDQNGTLVVTQRLTHQEIASMVGSSREMVTRILKELTIGGYVTVGNGSMTINRKLPSAR
jgi:CRP/FNR family cyclic AMP-dependent transcriptional regulator